MESQIKKEEKNSGARVACSGWQSDRRRPPDDASPSLLSSGRPWRRPVQDEDDTVRLDG